MDDDEYTSTKVTLPKFKGAHKDFQVWWTRFLAYAAVYRFTQAIGDSQEVDLPASDAAFIDTTTDAGKQQKAAKTRNNVAMANLTMAFESEQLMGLVYKAMNSDWPGGLAWKVVKGLKARYQPADLVTLVEMRQAMAAVSMKNDAEPTELFEAISGIENRFQSAQIKISDEEKIAVVLAAAPKEYAPVLTAEQRAKGAALTMDDLQDVMMTQWRQTHNTVEEAPSNEMTLAAFQGICYNCQKQGHRANQCPEERKPRQGRGGRGQRGRRGGRNKKKCRNCGKEGHLERDCWELDENAHKRPDTWRSRGSSNNNTNNASSNHTEHAQVASDSGARIEYLLTASQLIGEPTFGNDVEILLGAMEFPSTQEWLEDPNVWVGDTGATVHMTHHKIGMTNLKSASGQHAITMGNGQSEEATEIGEIPGTICDKSGTTLMDAKIRDVLYLPTAKYNLFSITKLQREGWKLNGDASSIWLTKGEAKIAFDIQIPTAKGMLYAMYHQRSTEVANAGAASGRPSMNITKAHDLLGHRNEDATRRTAHQLGWSLTRGTLGTCQACTEAKAKQKNIPRHADQEPNPDDDYRWSLDIATIRKTKNGPKVNKGQWRILVHARTGTKFSDFFDKKNDMVEPTCERLSKWKRHGKPVKFLRMDNAGENKLLQQRMASADWQALNDIQVEYTARNTPQQNHSSELGFSHLANQGRALMARAHIPLDRRYKVFKKAFETATKLDGLTVIELDGKTATRYEHFGGSNPAFSKHLRTWGEAGTVTLKTKSTPKVGDRGIACMFVGYAPDHAGDVYEMWDPTTDRIHITRDVIWLRRMFYERPRHIGAEMHVNPDEDFHVETNAPPTVGAGERDTTNQQPNAPPATVPTPSDENIPLADVAAPDDNDNNERAVDDDFYDTETQVIDNTTTAEPTVTRTGRVSKPPARLIESMNLAQVTELNERARQYEISLTAAEERYYDAMRELGELALVGAAGGSFTSTEQLKPMKYDEAMATEDEDEWHDAVEKEHGRMVENVVWEAVDVGTIPSDATVMTSTWAMKRKANGVFRARVNARGFEQIDGEHYNEDDKASPVANDITIRIVLCLLLMAVWIAHIMDVHGAFLKGRFKPGEVIYMGVPQGFEKYYPSNVVLRLLRTIYGLKQAAIAFWRETLQAFKFMKYTRSKADPCMQFKWTKYGLILWLSWVDDFLVCGPKEAVLHEKKIMSKMFPCDDLGEMTEYVGCKIERNLEEPSLKLTQPVMLQSFSDEFDLTEIGAPVTPAVPGHSLTKTQGEGEINNLLQSNYRKGVGKLLHLTRWTRPEIMNAVRELSRYMTGALMAHWRAMYRVMGYCANTPNRGLKIAPNEMWDGDPNFLFKIRGRADSDYAKDVETRRSISGVVTYLCGAVITTRSKMMPIVALSVTEAELFAAVMCVQDMLYIMRVLESMGLQVAKPMVLEIDNKGAKDLIDNWSVGGRLRHVEVKQFFLRELKEMGLLKVKWLNSEANTADLFTKNLGGPLFNLHTTTLCGSDDYYQYN